MRDWPYPHLPQPNRPSGIARRSILLIDETDQRDRTMTNLKIEPGDHVLLCAHISNDGRTVIVASGVELPITSVEIACEIPKVVVDGDVLPLLIVCYDEEDRQELIDLFYSHPGMETRKI